MADDWDGIRRNLERARILSWVAMTLAVLSLVLSCCPAHAETHLEWVPPLWHDTSNNPAGDPGNPRARGAEILVWRGTTYLVYGDGNELRRRTIHGDGSLGPYSVSHFDVPPPSDTDYCLFNWSWCTDCRFGVAAYNSQGTVLWDAGTGNTPLFGDNRRYQNAGSIGAFTFSYGTRQYLISRIPLECQGNSLAEITGLEPSDLRVVQCITDAGGTPLPVDAGMWLPRAPVVGDPVTGHILLFDSSYRRVHVYRVTTVGGDPHLEAMGWSIQAVWILDHGFDVDIEHGIAVSAYTNGMSVWNFSDPVASVLLSRTPLHFMVAAQSVELRWPYVLVSALHTVDTGSTHLFDLTRPEAPVEIDPHFWDAAPPPCQVGSVVPPGSEYPWNDQPCMSNKGGTWHGDDLYLSRYSVGERFHLIIDPGEVPLFQDGFESGDTGEWTEVTP